MGCCHSHSHSDNGEKKRDTPPTSGSSFFPLELDDGCSTKKPRPHLRSSGASRHSPPLPPVVAGSTGASSKSPPFLEEESVKEVIPESANRRSSPSLTPPPPNAAWFPVPQPPDLRKPPSLSEVDQVVGDDEETSEIYSASESQLSTSTIPEKMQEGDDWRHHKMPDRDMAEQISPMYSNNTTWTSPRKYQRRPRGGGGGNNNSSTSPYGGGDGSAAYSSYSPNNSRIPRRPQLRGGSRPGGRQMGVVPRNVPAAHRPEDKRRSGRVRSSSPAMRSGERTSSSMVGRTQNADADADADADAGEDKSPEAGGGEADSDSLDNPLVSLECFIFL